MLTRSTLFLALVAIGTLGAGQSLLQQRRLEADLRIKENAWRADERDLPALQTEHDKLAGASASLADGISSSPKHAAYPDFTDPGADGTDRHAEDTPGRLGPLFSPRIISTTGMKPVSAWADVGMATPQAALETQSWAFQHGDSLLAAKTIVLDDDTRDKVEAFLRELNPPERAKYDSPEQVVALLLGAFARKFSGVRFANPVVHSSDEVVLWTLWTYQDGHSREHEVHLRKSALGWQRVISDPEEFIAHALAPLNPKHR
jgi:hypothetical protein